MIKTFKIGGVHPPENKFSAGSHIQVLPLPTEVTIPVTQHIGAPAKVVVSKGDKVLVGQILAQAEGFVSANIHSSVSGVVTKIDTVLDSSGFKKMSVTIKVEGDEWISEIDRSQEIIRDSSYSEEEIKNKIINAGIVGLGGATFPSHVKISISPGKKAEFLILNGVECEPYLTSDHALMMEKGEEILIGATLLMKVLRVNRCVVGIENNKPDAIKNLQKLSSKFTGIAIQPLKVRYPQGGEKQLIKATINREVPSGGLPIDVGAVVFNVGSAFAVYEAVQKNKPLIERVVTVTGKKVSSAANYLVRIGTSMEQLIAASGGIPENTGKIISGGPMMGKSVANTVIPVIKGTSGVLLLSEDESQRGEQRVCIRCAKCVSVCPMGLEPFLLMTLSEKLLLERAENEKITDCIECGSCSYTCPSERALLDYIRYGKSKVIHNIRTRKR